MYDSFREKVSTDVLSRETIVAIKGVEIQKLNEILNRCQRSSGKVFVNKHSVLVFDTMYIWVRISQGLAQKTC